MDGVSLGWLEGSEEGAEDGELDGAEDVAEENPIMFSPHPISIVGLTAGP